jgi:release factor glutamine methyltransferase
MAGGLSSRTMSDDVDTIGAALAWARDRLRAASATARLDAELLLAHILGWSRARVLAEGRLPLADAQRAAFRDLVARRAALEPVAYLTGHKEFYGLDFVVDRRVLVPRPETELLIDLARQFAWRRRARFEAIDRIAPLLIADIGTGCGCIAVVLALQLPEAQVYAIDISRDALAVAGRNVARHGVTRQVRLGEGDLLDALHEPVDLIVSNPPYTVLSGIDEGVRRHEPRLALDGGPDGLAFYRRLLAAAPARLRRGGAVLIEIGATQSALVTDLARASFPSAQIDVYQDLARLDRAVAIMTREPENRSAEIPAARGARRVK